MKKNKDQNKSREPFSPENTPTPPQVMDTSKEPRNENRNKGKKEESDANAKQSGKKEKLLGESPTEIDDETTI